MSTKSNSCSCVSCVGQHASAAARTAKLQEKRTNAPVEILASAVQHATACARKLWY
jgi:hypothetical protein